MRIVLAAAMSLAASPAVAQCFEASFGTPLASPSILTGDIQLPQQAIGFAFPLGGTTYTHLHITDKGYAWLSNNGAPLPPAGTDFTASATELASQGPRLAPLWSDLVALATNNAQIWMNSTPTRCVVTWENLTCYQSNCQPFTMQMQLMVSGEVFFFWGPGATNNSTPLQPTWQVGVCGVSPGGGTAASSDLSSGGFTQNPVLVEEWPLANTFDLAARGLQLVPTNPGWIYNLPTGCTGASPYGDGCVQADDSAYEEWLSAFDFANGTVTWLRTGNGYVLLTSIPGTFVPPSAGAINIAPNTLDGAQVVTLSGPMPVPGGTTTTLNVTTKGQIEVASVPTPPLSIDYTPTVPELLNAANTTFALWHDYDQTRPGSGLILYEEVAGVAYITWNGVQSFSAAAPNTFQFQFDVASGNVTLVVGAMGGFASPDPGILGYSVAGPSPNPGNTDFSALTSSITLGDVGVAGLALAANGLPQLGNASFSLTTSNAPSLVPLGVMFFGSAVVNPGLDLTFLGMPGCQGYTNGDLGAFSFPVTLPTGTGTVALPIPNNPSLTGIVLSAQSICFSAATAFGLISSNGVQITVGP